MTPYSQTLLHNKHSYYDEQIFQTQTMIYHKNQPGYNEPLL